MIKAKTRMILMAAGGAALLTIAPTSAAEAGAKPDAKKAWMDAKPSGPPESCIPIVSIRNTRVRSDQVIDFYMRGGKVYRNTLPYKCSQLGFEERFTYATSLSQLCSTDIITVLVGSGGSGPITGPSCGLGQFQPVTGAGK